MQVVVSFAEEKEMRSPPQINVYEEAERPYTILS